MKAVTVEQAAALCVVAGDWRHHCFGGSHLQRQNFFGLEEERHGNELTQPSCRFDSIFTVISRIITLLKSSTYFSQDKPHKRRDVSDYTVMCVSFGLKGISNVHQVCPLQVVPV